MCCPWWCIKGLSNIAINLRTCSTKITAKVTSFQSTILLSHKNSCTVTIKKLFIIGNNNTRLQDINTGIQLPSRRKFLLKAVPQLVISFSAIRSLIFIFTKFFSWTLSSAYIKDCSLSRHIYLRSVLILFSHLRADNPSSLYLWGQEDILRLQLSFKLRILV
jgi:hypothetical protein